MRMRIKKKRKAEGEKRKKVKEAEVELVWEPAWNQGMISEAGKMKLGWV